MPLGFSVLVACADADLRDLLSWRLVVLGCSAASVSTCDQALDLLQRREFHLILVDDGLGAVELRERATGKRTTLIDELDRRDPPLAVVQFSRRGADRTTERTTERTAERGTSRVRLVAWPKDARAAEQLLIDAVEESCAMSVRRANSTSPVSVG